MSYFGTDGVRGIANKVLTSSLSYRIGRFIGQYPNGKANKIIIGRDTRLSGDMLLAALISGITSSGGSVCDLGITTTPSISFLVETNNFDYGIMISASHNPYFDNGIKIFSKNGEKLDHSIELLIEEYIDSHRDYLPLADNNLIGQVFKNEYYQNEYLDYIASLIHLDVSSFNVCFDLANGSSSLLAKRLFNERLHLKGTYINYLYDGVNINDKCGSTHPEKLMEKVKNEHFDFGFAFDGDADRMMMVNSHGELIDGDAIMYIVSKNLKKHNKLNDNKIVITVMSNFGLKKSLKEAGIDYLEVAVGDKNVQKALKDYNLSFGGEQSGHLIFNTDLNTGDGLLSAAHVLEILKDENKTIDELLEGYHVFPQYLENVGVSNKDALMKNDGLLSFIKEKEALLKDEGRILVRPSGTEQLIRVMVEAKELSTCKQIVNDIAEYIKDIAY
ncbi:MAG: phosphoglucosamine mutase [Bacilli bacterium]